MNRFYLSVTMKKFRFFVICAVLAGCYFAAVAGVLAQSDESAEDVAAAAVGVPAAEIAKKPAAKKSAAESPVSAAAAEVPLWDREPFDRIYLKTTRARNSFDIQRLTLPEGVRATPEALEKAMKSPKLQFHLIEDPRNLREIPFERLEKIMLFEDLLVAEAQDLIRGGKFDEAYECLKFLRATYPETRGLNQTYQLFLEREAANYFRQKNYEMALVRIYALVALNPKYARLPDVYVPLVEQLLKENLQKKEYAVAGQFLAEIEKVLPEDPGVKKLSAQVNKLVDDMLQRTQNALKEKDINTAIVLSRAMTDLRPKREDAAKIAAGIRNNYPQVNVGITWCANRYQPLGLNDWASLRSRRLLYRPLVEFFGPGPEGGHYESPLADLKIENLNRTLRLKIHDGVGWNGTDVKLTSYDISRQLLEMINPRSAQYAPLFAEVFQDVQADSVQEILVHLRRPHVIPAALLQTPVLPYTSGEDIPPDTASNGPFVLKAINEKPAHILAGQPALELPADAAPETDTPAEAEPESAGSVRYVTSLNYFHDQPAEGEAGPGDGDAGKSGKNRPLQIVETHFDKGRNGILALRANRIQALDRVNPWELGMLRDADNVAVVPYSVPRIHVLIPNRDTPALSNRTFRRALVYAINRETILSHLLGGKPVTGCQVVSGPFSRGTSFSDPLSYAYDMGLAPRPYNPYLATTLARVGVMQALTPEERKQEETRRRQEALKKQKAEKKQKARAGTEGENEDAAEKPAEPENTNAPTLPIPPLVLGYPPHELARVSCGQIKSYLEMVGIPITLYEFGMHEPVELRDGIDLLYAELTMAEPLLDARRLLSAQGPTRRSSSHMDLALRQLDAAMDWVEISRTLRRIHRLAYDDTAVIPLWQMVEHFAYNKSLEGVGDSPFTLYEHIESWRLK